MNLGLLRKAALELRWITLLFGGVLFAVEALLAFVVPQITDQFSSQLFQLRFVQGLLRAMLGTELTADAGPGVFLVICWVHPVVLSLAWAHVIVCTTRFPVGELDRGTLDVLLSLPVSRGQVLLAETLAWIGSSATVMALAVAGNLAGSQAAAPADRATPGQLVLVGINLLAVNLAVGGCGWLISAASQRHGKAILVLLGVVLVSFLLSYLGQFWAPARYAAPLSVLYYYQPLLVLRDGAWPWRDLVVLAAAFLLQWLAAYVVLRRRDLVAT